MLLDVVGGGDDGGGGGGGGGGVSGRGGGVTGISGSVSRLSKSAASEMGEYGGLSSKDTLDRVEEAGAKYTGDAGDGLRVGGLSSHVEGTYSGLSG